MVLALRKDGRKQMVLEVLEWMKEVGRKTGSGVK
jgi:hypothetical protein